MKYNLYLLGIMTLFQVSCVSLTVSDIKADVDAKTEVVATIYFDGTIHSDVPTSYSLYQNRPTSHSMDVSFKDFSGENYVYLDINQPTVLDINIAANFTSANLDFVLLDEKEKEIWTTNFDGNIMDETRNQSIEIVNKGSYKLIIKGKASKGNYKIEWN